MRLCSIGTENGRIASPLSAFNELHQLVDALGAALDAKNSYTAGHADRVADIAACLASRIGLAARDIDFVHIAGHLHDIGKIGVSDAVLIKEGPLSVREFEEIKRHPGIGYDILSKVESLRPFAVAVRHHHERWDGGGYPDGLSGTEIPLASRVIALADSWDAMTSARPYRARMPFAEALDELMAGTGTQFDPQVSAIFIELLEAGEGRGLRLN